MPDIILTTGTPLGVRPPFVAFNKIPRLRRECIITEKIDGTNAQVVVLEDGQVFAGSRTRYITPEQDNYGFAAWVRDHEAELRDGLGIGTHFGEWWGRGINRGYGLTERQFSLFNTSRWKDGNYPPCCDVVPVVSSGRFGDMILEEALGRLRMCGSLAAPGFTRPEGVVVYMTASGTMHKVLLEGDELPKGVTTRRERELANA